MKSWDTIIVGGGIIGLSLAISLRKQGLCVLVVERGEPGREASYAAAGMLASQDLPSALKSLAEESARLYPDFAHALEDESASKVDLRDQGTIVVSCDGKIPAAAEPLSPQRLRSLEPALGPDGVLQSADDGDRSLHKKEICAGYLSERSVDPRALVTALIKAAHHRQVDISSGADVKALLVEGGRVSGVKTERTSYSAPIVVNCAGAWAGLIAPYEFPVKPIKGQMLAVVDGPAMAHVVRAPEVYLVPRSDGRVVIGSTLEDVGFNKQTEIATVKRLSSSAVELVPGLAGAREHEAWAGLRPGTPDGLPILGETSTSGLFMATGHYRDGILLAPITAQVMTALIMGKPSGFELASFSPARFL